MSAENDFWSRRKARVAAEEQAEARAQAVAQRAEAEQRLEERSDEELLQELGLPEPESLKLGDDFSGFMKSGVPERLRRRALRTLWRSNPVLANLDGLNDYDDDFTDAATSVQVLKTSYVVGKGLLAHVQEMERQQAARDNPPIVTDTDTDAAPDEAPEEVTEPQLAEAGTAEPDEAPVAVTFRDDEPTMPAPRRRMKFTYQGDAA